MLKKELIFKIKRKIMEYESKMNSYKKSELEYLNRVPSIYDYTISFNDFKNFDLIYTGIILVIIMMILNQLSIYQKI